MSVTPEERDAMQRLLRVMNGERVSLNETKHSASGAPGAVILPGAGQITNEDVSAMADVLKRLENAVNSTSQNMIMERTHDQELNEALITDSIPQGVKVGIYKIQQQLDEHRMAGKQYYDVVNSLTGQIVAHELSLYEAAHGLVKLLNSGKYFNSNEVRELMEAESNYTSHKIDAVRYHRMMLKSQKIGDLTKSDLMETRKQASMDRAMISKRLVKKLYGN